MTGVYDRFGPSMARLIHRNGIERILTRYVAGDYDPTTGGSATITVSVTGTGALVGVTDREIANGTALQGDRKLLYFGEEIKKDDLLDGYRVAEVKTINSDDSGIVYQVATMRLAG